MEDRRYSCLNLTELVKLMEFSYSLKCILNNNKIKIN